jgi:hypothetical protein
MTTKQWNKIKKGDVLTPTRKSTSNKYYWIVTDVFSRPDKAFIDKPGVEQGAEIGMYIWCDIKKTWWRYHTSIFDPGGWELSWHMGEEYC